MRSERLEFPGSEGHALAARLDSPETPPQAFALFAHCFTCTKDIFAASRIAEALTQHGIAVLRFDFTGLGSSEGEFANTNFSSNVGDLIAACAYLRDTRQAPRLLVGHSLGGAAVLAAAGAVPEVSAVATIGAPADPAHVSHLFADHVEEIEAQGEAEVCLVGRPFRVKKQFLDDLHDQRQGDRIAGLKRALIVFHSPIDNIVGIDNAGAIFGAAKHPKSFVSLDSADHLLSKRADAEYVATVLAAWASRYIDAGDSASEPVAQDLAAKPGTVVVQGTGNGKFQQAVAMGSHRLLADEPVAYGGTDTGPTPYDLLLAALGTCSSMTMRLYADRKGWPLEKATVTLRHDQIHAKDCLDCETVEGKVDVIAREIALHGALDEDQRRRIIAIADKCPVHRTLHSEVKVRTTEVTW